MTGPGWFLQRLWWHLPSRHLSEDRLLSVALDSTGQSTSMAAAALNHLQTCGECEERLGALTAQLEAMPDTAGAGFDEVFTPQRLHTQRARIAHRLAQAVGQIEPARVLAFPFSVRPRRPLQLSPARWLAGAAAGLLLGVTAGQLLHYHPAGTGPQLASTDADDDAETTPATRRAAAELAAPSGTHDMTGTVELPPPGNTALASPITLDDFERLMADEEFLGSLDLALTSFQVSELESIDALTPRVRDLSINIR